MTQQSHFLVPALSAGLVFLLAPISSRAQVFPLYVSNGNNTVRQLTAAGAGSQFADQLSFPYGLAFDSAGNFYVATFGNSAITKFTSGGGRSVFVSSGLGNPTGLAFDSADNLYVSNTGNDTIRKFTPGGTGSLFANTGLSGVIPLVMDTSGNLYVASVNTIRRFTPAGAGTPFVTLGGDNDLRGLAFDHAGNLYAANNGDQTIRKFTPAGAGSIFADSTTGVDHPLGLAFDSTGNLYVANFLSNQVVKITPAGVGSIFAGSSNGVINPKFLAFAPAPSIAVRAAGFVTSIPGGTGNFTGLPLPPSLYGNSVVFLGEGSGGQLGVYLAQQGPPIKVVDLNTAIPGGAGNFTAIPGDPCISGNLVTFVGNGSGGQQGVYVVNPVLTPSDPPIKVVDLNTAIPGGTGNFTAIPTDPCISGNLVTFVGNGSGGQQGVYVANPVLTPNDPPIKVVDLNTAIPGGTGNFIAIPTDPCISGNLVTFVGNGSGGQQGVYVANPVLTPNDPPIKVVDLNTAIPGGTGNFTAIPTDPCISGNLVTFVGTGSGAQQGVYVVHDVSAPNPALIKVADLNTAIPGGNGNFTGFSAVSASATDVAFLGTGANGQQGIYDLTGGSLVKVIDLADILNDRAITGLQLSFTGLSGDPVAFQATFADGSQGIYTASVVPPFALQITAVEKSGADLRLSFTSQAGTNYAIQSRADLSSGSWATLPGTTNSGTGGTMQQTLTNALVEPQQFFRVQQLP